MSLTSVDFPASRVRAGVTRADITPPVGIYHRMWGAATHDRSTGVHRPLTATALCLAPSNSTGGQDCLAFIGLDHCLFWSSEMRRVLDGVAELAELPSHRIIFFFSHTHGAGLMGLERQELPGGDLIGPYLDRLTSTVGGMVRKARERMHAATIVYGAGRCGLATNRDYFDDQAGHYVCGFNPAGLADETVAVARLTSDNGSTLATVVNYACHPTTLAWDNTLISPDYVGAMREVVEGVTSAPCLFIQGASGDIGPREGFVGDTAVADRNGRQLGYAALATLEGLPPAGRSFKYAGPVVSGATIGTWNFQPATGEALRHTSLWSERTSIAALRCRPDLGSRESVECDRTEWQAQHATAEQAGDVIAARDARAMIERSTRRLTRLASLPSQSEYPYPIRAWRMGDAVWLAYDGEHYNILQRELRQRFPETPLIIGTLANGSNVWYLPDAESYGKPGLYQEEASVLAQGSLEKLIDASTTTIHELLA